MKTISRTKKYILASSIAAILTVTLFGWYSLEQYQANEVKDEHAKLETCIKTFWQLLSNKGTDFSVVDGKLLVGAYPVNGNFELPDKVQELFGGVATIFMGDERVSTNVLTAEGRRALGTRLVGPAYDAVFKQGKPYRGLVSILDVPYLTAYDPIRDSTGKVIGVLFVGVRESEFLDQLSELRMHLTLALFSALAVFTIFMAMLGRVMKRVEDANENQLKFQQTLIDTIPSPIFYKDADCRYLGCNRAFEAYVGFTQEELIGKTPHELWPKELADRYRQQDMALLEHPGTQIYEAAVKYADGTLRDVVFNKATFNESNGAVAGLVGVILDITERKQAEDAVIFQNILLSAQQDASIDGILVVDEAGKILSFNRRFVEIMGIPSHLLETMEDEPVLRYVTGRMADPQKFLEKVKHLYEHRQEICRDEISSCDGKILDRYTVPLLSAEGRYYGRFWSFRDVTEQRAAEEETKNAYQQLFNIVEFLPDATFVVDKEKRVIAWNRAIEEMSGIKKEEMLGRGDYAYSIPFYGERRKILIDFVDEDQETLDKYTSVTRVGRTIFAETVIPDLHQKGINCHLWGTASPLLDKDNKIVGAIESIRDITERRRAEQEKSLLESQLHHARTMESLMVRLGHDLRTPLTPMCILLPLIRGRVYDHDLKRMLDICCKNTITIKELTDKAGMLVNLASNVMPHELVYIQLSSAVDDCLAACADLFDSKGVQSRNEVDSAVLVQVVPAQIQELLANLILNAVRYSPEKVVIRIAAEQFAETVKISVIDDGIGVAPDNLERIFDEFFKVDESRHDLNTSGLGLSICRRIVQNHNGRIWAESAGLGHGTSICFTLNRELNGIQHNEKETAANG